ncbi:MAG TPA: hydrogenase maturation protease, partial [Desulfonauticus sp.]|nr:hydrogenase maturation protease [Desulfonauticus sp.]
EDIFSSPNLINSHAISVGTTLKTGYTVFKEEMPQEIKLYLIEVENIEEFSKTFTPAVAEAVEEVKKRIRAELR